MRNERIKDSIFVGSKLTTDILLKAKTILGVYRMQENHGNVRTK